MAKWILKNAAGKIVGQICTSGAAEPDERDNPDGLRAVRVNRHSLDLAHEVFDESSRRWKCCPTKKAARTERDRRHALRDELQGDALLERFLALEGLVNQLVNTLQNKKEN